MKSDNNQSHPDGKCSHCMWCESWETGLKCSCKFGSRSAQKAAFRKELHRGEHDTD